MNVSGIRLFCLCPAYGLHCFSKTDVLSNDATMVVPFLQVPNGQREASPDHQISKTTPASFSFSS